jgi:hypothetical protein
MKTYLIKSGEDTLPPIVIIAKDENWAWSLLEKSNPNYYNYIYIEEITKEVIFIVSKILL